MKKILITGATGLIGRQISNRLAQLGHEVHCVSRKNNLNLVQIRELKKYNLSFHNVNFLNSIDFNNLLTSIKPNVFYHLAWETEHSVYKSSASNKEWLTCSTEAFTKFYDNGGENIVAAGTCAEYDWSLGQPLKEDSTPENPQNFYAENKLLLSKRIHQISDIYSRNYTWARIFFAFGEGEPSSKIIPLAIKSLQSGEFSFTSSGKQRIDFIHSKDAADFFVSCMDTYVNGCINVGCGLDIELGKYLKIIQSLVGGELKFSHSHNTSEKKLVVVADTSKAKKILKQKLPKDINNRLEEMVKFYLKERKSRF